MLLKSTFPHRRGDSTELVVILHAWTSSAAKLTHVRKAIEEVMPNADLLIPEYPAGVLSSADPLRITQELIHAIDVAVETRAESGCTYYRIILIGHSLGALLVRKAFVWASGRNEDAPGPLRSAPKAWAARVERIILLAGINRGWTIEKRPVHMPLWKWLSFRLAEKLYRWLRMAKLINRVRRGAPFVVNLQIQWINLVREKKVRIPPTIQLLGSVDDIVSQEDNVDVQSGADFIYKNVPDTGHANVIDFSGETGAFRKGVFVQCVRTDITSLKSDYLPGLERDYSIKHVVFIMHGIRDYGFWTADVDNHLKRLGKNVHTVPSSYGYFPMLGFLLQPERQDKVRWFMDQYTQALAQCPNGRLSFVGHSNGTYLLASALQRYRACSFDNVVFAGSVVPRHFPWDAMVRDKRIGRLQNYVATKDWVVAIFPAVFERLFRNADLGSAGHNGFTDTHGQRLAVTFIYGSHGAALVRENLEVLARFALGDETAAPAAESLLNKRCSLVVLFSKLCPLIWLLLFAFVLGLLIVPVVYFGFPLWWPIVGSLLLYCVLRWI